MASSENGAGGESEGEVNRLGAQLGKILKEEERILAPSRRPDGTYRKSIRIRPGYFPQDEVTIYQSKGALWKKEMESSQELPPGYEPGLDAKPKSKSAKRNEKKKERLQAALDKDKNLEKDEVPSADVPVNSVSSQINGLSISANAATDSLPSNATECSVPKEHTLDIDKRIRALKKKIRLTEAQQQKIGKEDMKPEQLEKVTKLEVWRQELKLLEFKKAEVAASAS